MIDFLLLVVFVLAVYGFGGWLLERFACTRKFLKWLGKQVTK